MASKAEITYDSNLIGISEIIQKISALGYHSELIDNGFSNHSKITLKV